MQALCETCFTSTVVELRSQCLKGLGLTIEKLQLHNRYRGREQKIIYQWHNQIVPMAQWNQLKKSESYHPKNGVTLCNGESNGEGQKNYNAKHQWT